MRVCTSPRATPLWKQVIFFIIIYSLIGRFPLSFSVLIFLSQFGFLALDVCGLPFVKFVIDVHKRNEHNERVQYVAIKCHYSRVKLVIFFSFSNRLIHYVPF